MVLAEHPLAYLKGLLVKRLCLVVSSLVIEVVGDIIVAHRRVWMVLAEHPLAYLKGLLVKRLCLAVSSLGIEVGGDIIVDRRRVWMVLTKPISPS